MSAQTVNQSELLQEFADEALASLRSLPQHLQQYRQSPAPEPINAVFRGVHSLKGNAGFFGLTAIKSFAHTVENTLDQIRGQLSPISAELEKSLTASFDLLDNLINAAISGTAEEALPPLAEEILNDIARHSQSGGDRITAPTDLKRILELLCACQLPGIPTPTEWLEAVADTQLDSLRAQLTSESASPVTRDSSAAEIPTVNHFAGVQWSYPELDLAHNLTDILRLFAAFAEGKFSSAIGQAFLHKCEELAPRCRDAGLAGFADALESAASTFRMIADSPIPLDETLVGVLWDTLWPELFKLLASAEATADKAQQPHTVVASAANSPAPPSANREKANRLVRVKEERLDEFLNLVARLFITGEMLKDLQARMAETRAIKPMVEEFREIIRGFADQAHALQKGLFSLRRVPVSNLFSKFPGMARSLARDLGKQVEVRVVGEEIEIDKVLLEDLDAPLTHIIRNAVDHGIDAPESRRSRNAAECGQITMTAELTRTHVRVLIADNGRGIDPNKLRAKALEKRLFTEAELNGMSDEEAVQLIFHPGFSTAEKLSDVSGRGVGLDVVRNTVRKHRGEVYVTSKVNVGTTFRLEVPLREAVLVIDGLMVRHSGEEFVIPFEYIREITQLSSEQLLPMHGTEMASIRNTLYDARSLGVLLDSKLARQNYGQPLSAVVVGTQYGRMCLLVDQVLGTRKVVVNGLKDVIAGSTAIAGVAQLGGGRLALVVSVPEIMGSLVVGAASETSTSASTTPQCPSTFVTGK